MADIDTAAIREKWHTHTVVEALCDEVDRLRARFELARRKADAEFASAVRQGLRADKAEAEFRKYRADVVAYTIRADQNEGAAADCSCGKYTRVTCRDPLCPRAARGEGDRD